MVDYLFIAMLIVVSVAVAGGAGLIVYKLYKGQS